MTVEDEGLQTNLGLPVLEHVVDHRVDVAAVDIDMASGPEAGLEQRVDRAAIAVHDVGEILLVRRITVPKGAGPHPVMIYLHGGGWAFGSPTSFRKLGMQFAEAGYLTIVLDYRLAPEHPFPAALEDTVFAIRWAKDNARRWNGDGGRIAIGGDSAGANLALSALTSSAPELRSLVKAAVLFYGAYDLQATADRTRSLPGLQEQLNTYVSGGQGSLDDPRVTPLHAVAQGALPPCFIIGAGEDTWCLADSLALAQALSAATSPYELHLMEGMPHGFMQMSALDGCRAAMRLMWEFLARNV